MRVAIVGAGVAGLTAAYLLNRAHEIELFEANDYAGGHANTVQVGGLGLDTGFIVYNEHTYPGFTRLLRELDVPTKAGDMSLSVSCRACRIEYSSRGIGGWFAQRRTLARPARLMIGIDMLRFYRDTARALRDGGGEGQTIAEFARARRYGGEFMRHFIAPLAAAVWSTPAAEVMGFPARYFLRFLHNHGIIGLQPAHVWRTIDGGSQRYVRAMTNTFPCRTRLSTPVRAISRDAEGVDLLVAGARRRYDHVVLACHADDALRLLTDATDLERRALGGFSYTENAVALHTDASLLPRRLAARASWNYRTGDCRARGASLGMTFHLNRLQALDTPIDYCLSLNAGGIDPARVIREMTYAHPRYTFETLAAQEATESLQGGRRTFFAGAHLGYGFHEDGVASAERVAARLGVTL